MKDYRDFNITWPGHPKYQEGVIIQQDDIRVIIQKIEVCLFTNKGDYSADLDLGCDLEYYLWQTTVSPEYIKGVIKQQFKTYIPELELYNYTLDVSLMEGSLQDILIVDITINDVGVKAIFR